MKTIYTLLHSENRTKLVAALAGALVVLSSYTGILPAPLDQYKGFIDGAAMLVTALGLIQMDPKQERK